MSPNVLLVVSFVSFASISRVAEGLERRIVKRGEIDLQTCINNFDIHTDKIIRTQDSRDMGAKYLNEIDLGSREECLRLCCETENCDVFVFEEKNSGGCYLFHCGPPEDFKCKFTHHVNYSSAVLAINRYLPDLESQIKLTKHEQDLTKLRKPDAEFDANPPAAAPVRTTPSTTTTTAKTKEVLSVEKPKSSEERKCHRYQFECRSTGECIAIYNACDGIPQCADGSDEAPELGCPSDPVLTTVTPVLVRPNPPSNVIYNQNNQQSPPVQAPINNNPTSQEVYRQPPAQQQVPIQQGRQVHHQQEDFIRPGIESRVPMIPQPVAYDPPQIQPYVPMQPRVDTGWIPHQSNQMSGSVPQYVDKNSHIFNHKESGLQVPDGQETSQIQYGDANSINDYKKVQSYYGDMYNRPLPPVRDSWQDDSRYVSNAMNNNNQPMQETGVDNREWRHQQVTDQLVKSDAHQEQPSQLQHLEIHKTEKDVPTQIQEKMASDLKKSKEYMEHAPAANKKIKIASHEKPHANTERKEYPDVMAYKMSQAPEVAVDDTPSGAILSLTLGLIITCMMAILIGCRLRVIKRRMRKCGKSYAHDADYLVNGMYL